MVSLRKIENMGTVIKTWFCSDLHISHTGAIHHHPERLDEFGMKFEEFFEDKNIAMAKYDEYLIQKWNSIINRQDNVYILGDFCLGNRERTQYILSRLHGKKFLIRGNHDKSCKGLENYFEWVGDIKEAKFTNNQYDYIDPEEPFCVEMCHYPLLTWNRRPHGTCCLMGHCHGSLDELNKTSKELRVDVGYDASFAKECGGFIELHQLYDYFCELKKEMGVETFQEYNEKLMEIQGYRA